MAYAEDQQRHPGRQATRQAEGMQAFDGVAAITKFLDHAGATAMVAEDMLLPLAEAGIAAAGREQLVTVRGVIGAGGAA